MDDADEYERKADEIKRLFLDLVAEKRPGRRKDAYRQLSSSGDPQVRRIGEIGLGISRVITGEAGPESLEDPIKNTRTLPATDYWHGFVETGGQMLLLKALAIPRSDVNAKELFRYGFDFINQVIADGFPISSLSVDLLKRAKAADPGLEARADDLMKRNASFLPFNLPKRPKAGRESGDKRERNRH